MSIHDHISEPVLRFGIFAAVFAVMALLELAFPRRPLGFGRLARWITNLGMLATGSVVVRAMGLIASPLVAVGAAALAAERGWGVLNAVDLPGWARIGLTLLALDFAIWLQHLASHKISLFWRLHRMHHADPDIDLTTGIRFHPVEIVLSMLYKVVWVVALGAPPGAVVLFEAILNGCAVFHHANVRLPAWLDHALRLLIVTPDMHRVHHSVERREHDSNYGFNLSIWDRMLGTYVAQPALGHEAMTIGLAPWQSEKPTRYLWCLRLPWLAPGEPAHAPPRSEAKVRR